MALEAPVTAAGLTPGPDSDRTPPITTDDLGGLVNATAVDQMQRDVDAAIGYVEERCGPIEGCQWVYRVRQYADGRLLLPSGAVASIDKVIDPYGIDRTADVLAQDVTWRTGTIAGRVVVRGEWIVQVTTSREASAVAALKEAAAIIARHLWTIRRGPLTEQTPATRMSVGLTTQMPAGLGYAIPARAQQLIGDYTVAGIS